MGDARKPIRQQRVVDFAKGRRDVVEGNFGHFGSVSKVVQSFNQLWRVEVGIRG